MTAPEDISFAFLIQDITLLLRKHFDRRAVRYGLTRAQWRALRVLHVREGICQSELAELLDMEPIAVGRVIDRLQAAGFVERRPDPSDRRRWKLYITAQASGVADGMEEIARGIRRDASRGLSIEQLEQAVETLRQIKHNLRALERDTRIIEPSR